MEYFERMPGPDRNDVEQRVRDFVASNFYVTDPAELEPDALLVERGVIDSTGILEVVSFLETEYGVRILDEELLPENLGSIARIAAFVARKRARAA
jgi:acyl carrier protein